MPKINDLKKYLDSNIQKKISLGLFALFLVFNLYYFISNFLFSFLNKGGNADEYYEDHLYTVTGFSIEKVFYTASQPYIFLSSCVDYFLRMPKISTRLISLVVCIGLIVFFIKKIKAIHGSSLEKIYNSTLFVCAIFITNQMYIGTSDFLSFALVVFPFFMILESIDSKKINLNKKQAFIIGLLFAFAIATRPTSIILILLFFASMVLILGLKSVFFKENIIILISGGFFLFLINFLPMVQKQEIVLDVKEIPKETGVNWFQRNYLMAKFWDSKQIPNTQWVSTKEVIEFKKQNPTHVFPKNQIDLLMKEPGLYARQMVRMFVKGVYSSFRFMYFLFPILLLSFLNWKKIKFISDINSSNQNSVVKNKIIIIFHLISIVAFSFIAVKMFEFRWIIPIMILYTFYAINYLSKLPEKIRFLVYNLSFISGILLYTLYFF